MIKSFVCQTRESCLNSFFLPCTQFKKGDIYFNYGCFPQTWEDPTHFHPDADGCRGDNDPVDVVEIGARIIAPGVSWGRQ